MKQISDEFVEAVEKELGVVSVDFGNVYPKRLIAAVLKVRAKQIAEELEAEWKQ